MVWAYSSGVEHYVDIVGVPSSNLGTPTIAIGTIAIGTIAIGTIAIGTIAIWLATARLLAGFLCGQSFRSG